MRLDRTGEPAGSPGEPQAPGPAPVGAAEPGLPPMPPAAGPENTASGTVSGAVETAPAVEDAQGGGVAAAVPPDDVSRRPEPERARERPEALEAPEQEAEEPVEGGARPAEAQKGRKRGKGGAASPQGSRESPEEAQRRREAEEEPASGPSAAPTRSSAPEGASGSAGAEEGTEAGGAEQAAASEATRGPETSAEEAVGAAGPDGAEVGTSEAAGGAEGGSGTEQVEEPKGTTGASAADGASGGEGAEGNAMAEPPKKRSGRNLPIAVSVGLGLGGLVLASLYYVKELFLAVMVVFLVLGLNELAGAFKTRDIRVPVQPLGVGLVAAPVVAYAWGPEALVAALALIVLTVLVWRMADGPADGYVRDVTAAVFVTGYLILMGGIVALLMAPDDGDSRIVIFISVTVASDIGGFFAGTFFGRHKLAPSISPKKTWEGVTGSALACMLVGAWLMWWLLDDGTVWHGVLIGATAVFTATVGDLIESMLKRDLGIKDMGSLLPEHGGVMDRLDSLLATAPVVWLLLELFVPST
ncbi:hypothetical protein GCM10010191_91210 [Actinomadura vinacea]|uniref:Phosphatidate cytidylyltransferase n=1 Tax=Actinomadura vinacea TaxID=115336 RepID=A0ABN3KEG2_9ACTN